MMDKEVGESANAKGRVISYNLVIVLRTMVGSAR